MAKVKLVRGGGDGSSEVTLNAFPVAATETPARGGAKPYDASSLTLEAVVTFAAVIENTLDSTDWYAEAWLYDVTGGVEITGSRVDNTGASDRSVAEAVVSGPLTVGTSPGNIRSDATHVYEVQIGAAGTVTDPATQRAVLSGATLNISTS